MTVLVVAIGVALGIALAPLAVEALRALGLWLVVLGIYAAMPLLTVTYVVGVIALIHYACG